MHISLFPTLKYLANPAYLISDLTCSIITTRRQTENMSRKGKEWTWYHRGGNKNVRYFEVWCNYCLLHAKATIIRENPGLALMPGDDHGEKELLELGLCSHSSRFTLSLTPSSSYVQILTYQGASYSQKTSDILRRPQRNNAKPPYRPTEMSTRPS